MTIRTLILAVVAAVAIPAATLAAGPYGGGPGWPDAGTVQPRLRADLNGDGVVTAKEHAEFRGGRPMLRGDLNGDGTVTPEERATVRSLRPSGWPCPFGGTGRGRGW